MTPARRHRLGWLAATLIGAAVCMMPPELRARYYQEWMAELEEYRRQGISLLQPALRILATTPATRRALRPARHALRSSLRGLGDWLFRLNDGEAYWRGWQITTVHAALGRRYRDPRFDTLPGPARSGRT